MSFRQKVVDKKKKTPPLSRNWRAGIMMMMMEKRRQL
jgi:hypothetical protein